MRLTRILSFLLGTLLFLGVVGGIAAWLVYEHFSQDLPDYYQLASYDPPVVSRIYAGDGRLLAEYATENRVFVPMSAMPKRVINAFLAAEDKTFYTHHGVDLPGVINAVWTNIKNLGDDRRPVGASTITQQVTKNFLLSNEVSYKRKIREMILALRIEKAFTKDRILELYLNQIYLGSGNYGVATAALNYFNKSLDELTIGEAAYLGALPKAPNNYNIVRDHQAALDRRNWVIDRMLEDGHITAEEADAAKAEPLELHQRAETEHVVADYFAEEVRREIAQRFGEDGLYKKGLAVRATIDPRLQELADRVLRQHLVAYDKRRAIADRCSTSTAWTNWQKTLEDLPPMPWLYSWQPAIVTEATKATATIGFKDGTTGEIKVADLGWAHPRSPEGRLGPAPSATTDVLKVGDIIAVEPLVEDGNAIPGRYALRQVPEISGAMVAMDPHTGRVLAMTGGWSYQQSRVQPRHPGQAPAGLVLQAARLSGGAGVRLHALHHDPRRADRDRPGPGPAAVAAGELRAGLPRRRHHAPRSREFAQPDDHPHGADRRHGQGGGDGLAPRRHRQHAADARHVAGRGRDHRAAPRRRLRRDRQRRQEGRADADRPRAGRQRLDHLSPRPAPVRRLPDVDLQRRAAAGDSGHAPAGARSRDRLPDGLDAGRRGEPRHRHRGEGGRQAAGRQDRHHQ